MILVAGESLMDIFPVEAGQGEGAHQGMIFRAHAGGSPFNVAMAIGRLGVPVQYLCPLSRDRFGEVLANTLKESRVDIELCPRTEMATTLGFVDTSQADGSARYVFYTDNTAGCGLRKEDLPTPIPPQIRALHFGSFSIGTDPIGHALESLKQAGQNGRVISVDPNIRPFLIRDREAYETRLASFLDFATLIKLSDEDLEWMHPGMTSEQCCARYLSKSARLVVVTRGSRGLLICNRHHQVTLPAASVDVIDTVGAGDTCQAAILTWLTRQQVLEADDAGAALDALDEEQLRHLGSYAVKASGITCSRAGCNPPWQTEMEIM